MDLPVHRRVGPLLSPGISWDCTNGVEITPYLTQNSLQVVNVLSAISIDVLNNFTFAMAATSGLVVSVLIAVLLQNQNEIARYLREGDPTDDYFPYLERQVRFIRLSIILALILLILQ